MACDESFAASRAFVVEKDAVNAVAFFQQLLGEIGTVLSGDASDERGFVLHGEVAVRDVAESEDGNAV